MRSSAGSSKAKRQGFLFVVAALVAGEATHIASCACGRWWVLYRSPLWPLFFPEERRSPDMSLKKRLIYLVLVGIIDLIFPNKGWGQGVKATVHHGPEYTVTRILADG